MDVLVIGGTRFVGYFLAWRLLAQGHRVTLLNRGSSPDPFGDRVERLHCDRTTAQFDEAVAGRAWDACVDFAGYVGADAERAVRALGDRIGHYVFISTGQVYLVREGCTLPATEDQYAGPVMPPPSEPHDLADWEYGVGKRAAEDVLEAAWRELGFPSTRLRIPMVNGERDHFRRVESYLWRLLDGGPVLVPHGGQHPCRHVYGREVARAVSEILGRRETFGEAYNLCQEEQPTLVEVLTLLAGMLGAPARLQPIARADLAAAGLRPLDVSPFSGDWMSHLDPSRITRELGFRHLPPTAYLEAIVAHFLANPPEDRPANYRHRETELRLASSYGNVGGLKAVAS
jgi:nucleoside-diphosphate-sugar epimerase